MSTELKAAVAAADDNDGDDDSAANVKYKWKNV